MKQLELIRILELYDIPQLFLAKDAIGTNYICVLYSFNEEMGYIYNSVSISENRLKAFLDGKMDLRSMYTSPEDNNLIYDVYVKDNKIEAQLSNEQNIPEEKLPEEGYIYMHQEEDEDESLISECQKSNRPIIKLKLENEYSSNELDSTCLSEALYRFQSLISNGSKKILGKGHDFESILSVQTFERGSFVIVFKANQYLDAFGSSDLDKVLRKIDEIFHADKEEDLKSKIDVFKGNTIKSYKNFLKTLINNKLTIKYKWVSSVRDKKVIRNSMDTNAINRLYDILYQVQPFDTEEKKAIGVFMASSVMTGRWFFETEDGTPLNGESVSVDLLSGVTIQKVKYLIDYDEHQEMNVISTKISYKRILKSIEKCEDGNDVSSTENSIHLL